jgi:hypothetical protein
MPPITQETSTSEVATLTPMRVPFCEIIPEDAVKPARTPVIDLVANQPLVFTKISDNPFLAINKARMLACDLDLPVQF